MAYFRNRITAGATVETTNSYTKRVGVKTKGSKEKVTPEEMQKNNQANAERTLRLRINANFKEDDIFTTITYRKEERPTPEEAKKIIKKFLTDLRKEYKKWGTPLKYINVTEYESKAIHHHILVNHIPGVDTAKIIRKCWRFGRPDFKYLDNTGQYKDLAAYLIKETSRTYKLHDGGHRQRYSCSRNLIKPPTKTEIMKAINWPANPIPKKGYYIDQDTIYNGTDPFTGRAFQRYTMIKISGSSG
jgi:hypothetical protein